MDFPALLPYEVRQVVEQALLVFATLFPIINPIGAAPVFLAMTPGIDRPARERLSRSIGINAFMLLLGAVVFGVYVIEFFGVSVAIVKVAGGLLVCTVAYQLINSGESQVDVRNLAASVDDLHAKAFYPFTLPLTVGPGSIAAAITLGVHAPHGTVRQLILTVVGAAVGAALAAASIYILFRFSDRISKVLGTTGTMVVLKLSAFILLCIGVQIIWNGFFELLGTVPTIRPR